jgi:hypothetical protein
MSISSEERKEYQREYYRMNKKKISKRKKDRYQNDLEAREKAKEAAKLYRAKKKAEEDRLRAEGKLPISKPKKNYGPVYININGNIYIGHSIKYLADNIGRGVSSIKGWIKDGTIPDTPIRGNRGQKLYTDGMILSIKIALQYLHIKSSSYIYNKIVDEWKNIGIDVG